MNRLTPEQERRALALLRALPAARELLDEVSAAESCEDQGVALYEEVLGPIDVRTFPGWRQSVVEWLYEEHRSLGARPIDLLRTPQGAERVRDQLDRIAAGALG